MLLWERISTTGLLLTAFCLIGAFLVPQNAYWFMTPKAVSVLEEAGIDRKFISLFWRLLHP